MTGVVYELMCETLIVLTEGRLNPPNPPDPLTPLTPPDPLTPPTDPYRYCTLHCTGYMRSWLSSQLDAEGDAADRDASSLTCLVTVCRQIGRAHV